MNDQITAQERYADACVTSHLCGRDADALGAAGMVRGEQWAFSLFRAKYALDDAEQTNALRGLKLIATSLATRGGITASSARRAAVLAFRYWLHDDCPACHGTRYVKVLGQPYLSDELCPACNGTGKPPRPAGRLVSDLLSEIAEAERRAGAKMMAKLRVRMEL